MLMTAPGVTLTTSMPIELTPAEPVNEQAGAAAPAGPAVAASPAATNTPDTRITARARSALIPRRLGAWSRTEWMPLSSIQRSELSAEYRRATVLRVQPVPTMANPQPTALANATAASRPE